MYYLKKLMLLILFILSFPVIINSQIKEFRKIENKAFTVGEKLTFDVKYGFITAGIAVIEIPKIKKIGGRDAYHVTFKVNSVSSFDPFYKVRDRYETYIDVEGIFPWRFEQHIREGGFTMDFSAFAIALCITSLGIFTPLPLVIAVLNLGFISGSLLPPPSLTAIVISLDILEKIFDLLASNAPFFLFMVDHLLCPDIL